MTTKQLIEALRAMPQDAEVRHLWDGSTFTKIEHVWLSRGGYVVTADFNMPCYFDEDRPTTGPTRAEDSDWRSGAGPKEVDDL